MVEKEERETGAWVSECVCISGRKCGGKRQRPSSGCGGCGCVVAGAHKRAETRTRIRADPWRTVGEWLLFGFGLGLGACIAYAWFGSDETLHTWNTPSSTDRVGRLP
jgi:hypothetical protein